MQKKLTKILWYGSDIDAEGKAVAPAISVDELHQLEGINYGEIYICNNPLDPAIFIRTTNDSVVRISGDSKGPSLLKLVNAEGEEVANIEEAVAIKSPLPFFSVGDVAAFGMPTSGGSGGSGGSGLEFSLLDDWNLYSPTTASAMALGANLGKELKDDIETLKSSLSGINANITIKFIGPGNAVSDASFANGVLTLRKNMTFVDKSFLKSMFSFVNENGEELPDSLGATHIKSKLPFYSVGDVTAFGQPDYAGSGNMGSTTLAGLEDVLLSSPTNGQILQYDGSRWVNSSAPVTFSASVTGSGGFIKAASVSGNVLTLTRGALSSSDITGALGYTPFDEYDFTKANIKSTLGISNWALASNKPSYDLDDVLDGSSRKLSNYLPLTGGTLTGTLNGKYISQSIIESSEGIKWITELRNRYNHESYTTRGIGIRLILAADSDKKNAGVAAFAESQWANKVGMAFYTMNTARVCISSGGFVGIGATTPAYMLDIASSTYQAIRIKSTNDGGGIRFENAAGNFLGDFGFYNSSGNGKFVVRNKDWTQILGVTKEGTLTAKGDVIAYG